MRRNIPLDERSPVRRGRPRQPKVISVPLDGDMYHALANAAGSDKRPVAGMVRKILAVALETPDLWLDTE